MTFCDLPLTRPTAARSSGAVPSGVGSSGVGPSGLQTAGGAHDDDDISLSQQLSQCSVGDRYSKEVYNVSVDPENEGKILK